MKKQADLNNRLKAYGSKSIVVVFLGFAAALSSISAPDSQEFFILGFISLTFIFIGGSIGVYCWLLLYLARNTSLSLSAHILGLTAASIPVIIVYKIWSS